MTPIGAEGGPGRSGVMMYTVLREARADLEGTLARLASIGYLGIETYGLVEHFGPARVRAAIAAAGLTLTSAHTPFPAGERAEAILDENEELGAGVLVWSMEREEFDSPAAIRRGAERVNEAADRAAARDMTIAYHNHFAEFAQSFDGRQAYDLLLDELDGRVLVELDAYWARMGGADPAEVLARLGDRVRLLHVKDGAVFSPGGQPPGDPPAGGKPSPQTPWPGGKQGLRFARQLAHARQAPGIVRGGVPPEGNEFIPDLLCPIGEGPTDWARVLRTPSGVRWRLVELERLNIDVFEALERSYAYLVGSGLSAGSVPAS